MSKQKKQIKHTQQEYDLRKWCPICNRPSLERINITNDNSYWRRCCCGVIFQEELQPSNVYGKEYKEGYTEMKEADNRSKYALSRYVPLMEDLGMGRKVLEVGYNMEVNKEYMNDRGWIYWGIDINKTAKSSNRFIKGDFETFEFNKPDTEEDMKVRFDMIWMSHVLEHFMNPIAAIKKCYDLLSGDGTLFIATPSTDWIYAKGVSGWGHWKKKEHYIFWNLTSLKKELEKQGFRVILGRNNYSMRYTSWDDLHIIVQKNCM